jgi:DNA-binding GntR family transcriptional regulator
MPVPDYVLDLDRNLPQTIHEQACNAIINAIRANRPGFTIGEKLTSQELSRQNAIHRNTLANVMSELVRLGYLRRLPNKGFEVVQQDPERPSLLTQHILSLTDVAERDQIQCRSQLIHNEIGLRKVSDFPADIERISQNLGLAGTDMVSVLARCRLMKKHQQSKWEMISIEQSFFSTRLVPKLLAEAIQQIQKEGDASVYRLLHRVLPNEDFFKAHYEISSSPLPETLAKSWVGSTDHLIAVLSITYCSKGPVELTRTWFDSTKATLTAGSLDVKLVD